MPFSPANLVIYLRYLPEEIGFIFVGNWNSSAELDRVQVESLQRLILTATYFGEEATAEESSARI
jgi:hypothetical protein